MQIQSLLNPEECKAPQTPLPTLSSALPPFSTFLSPTTTNMVSTRPPNPSYPIKYDHHDILSFPGTIIPPGQASLARKHVEFSLTLRDSKIGLIRQNTKKYLYSSIKTPLLFEIGRDGVEVFEYSFCLPDNPESKYNILWDYNIGLVQLTPFFKALGHSKVIPSRALAATPGLKEIAISLTGGDTGAQGYWVAYECARALCKTFCYNIRWALTPIFGPNFVNECIAPDQPGYEEWRIDPAIVQSAQREFAILRKEAAKIKGRVKTSTASRKQGGPTSSPSPPAKRKLKRADTQDSSSSIDSERGCKRTSKKDTTNGTTRKGYVSYGNMVVNESPPISPKTVPTSLNLDSPFTAGRPVTWEELDEYREKRAAAAEITYKRLRESASLERKLHVVDVSRLDPNDDRVLFPDRQERVIRSPPSSPPAKKIKPLVEETVEQSVEESVEPAQVPPTDQNFTALDAANALVAMQHTP